MKAKEKVQIRTLGGLADAPCFHQWKHSVGGIEFSFALHTAAGIHKGLDKPLAISELGTGFDVKAVLLHPNSRNPLTENSVKTMPSAQVKKIARAALYTLINKKVGPYRFLQAMVGAQMQVAKVDLSKYEVQGTGTETYRNTEALDKLRGMGTPGTATFSTTATMEQRVILDQVIEGHAEPCAACEGTKVLTTTNLDHDGQPIEIACTECVPKGIGGVGFRFDAAMTPGHPAAEQYLPTPEEAAATIADAEQINRNLAKYGTIDSPPTAVGDWASPTEEEWYESLDPENKLEYLRQKLAELQAASKTLSAKATKADYDRIDDIDSECRHIEAKIKELEEQPCSK